MTDFIDLFMPGEGEEVLPEIVALYKKAKDEGWTKEQYLSEAARIPGVYIPSLYEVSYHDDGKVKGFLPKEGAPMPVRKRIIKDLDKVFFPENFVVRYIDIVHDRSMLEIMRGCIRGCRFCQAGFIYRPVREKHADTLCHNAHGLCDSTGYEELSLTSLSTSDYSELEPLLDGLIPWTEKEYVNIAVPSLRIDNFSESMLVKITKVRKSGLTFAAEAGTQRMRDVINKNVTEENILGTCKRAFEGGYTSVKLYFMIGLPTETDEDVLGVIDTAQKVVDLYYSLKNPAKGKAVQVTCSVASFVPKPFTPFEFEPQDTMEELQRKQQLMLHHLHTHKISLDWHDARTSFIEAVFARGDRRLARPSKWAMAARLQPRRMDDHFKFDVWMQAFAETGLDPLSREPPHGFDERCYRGSDGFRGLEGIPDPGKEKARNAVTTPNCRLQCAGCGVTALKGGPCFE
jgi:radical SAM family uncharacterized protein